jgi:hypothetical protein
MNFKNRTVLIPFLAIVVAGCGSFDKEKASLLTTKEKKDLVNVFEINKEQAELYKEKEAVVEEKNTAIEKNKSLLKVEETKTAKNKKKKSAKVKIKQNASNYGSNAALHSRLKNSDSTSGSKQDRGCK